MRSPVKNRVSSPNPEDTVWIVIFGYRISEWTQMSISERFRYRNDGFQSDIFSSDIGITEVDMSDIADIKIDVDAHPMVVTKLEMFLYQDERGC